MRRNRQFVTYLSNGRLTKPSMLIEGNRYGRRHLLGRFDDHKALTVDNDYLQEQRRQSQVVFTTKAVNVTIDGAHKRLLKAATRPLSTE